MQSSRTNVVLCVVLLILTEYITQQVSSYAVTNPKQCMKYLKRFGYMTELDTMMYSKERALKKSIQEFQEMTHINKTGVLDEETMSKMNTKRCGNPDKGPEMMVVRNRKRRYVLEASGRVWQKRYITYKITQHSKNKGLRIHRKTINEYVAKAFQLWASVANINLIYSKELPVDIEIKFRSAKHDEDEYAFDGPGNTLAHAFPPGGNGIAGDIHFDDEEMWDIIKDNNGSNFFWVVVHEIGHSLGLAHSLETGSIMHPFAADFNLDLQLHSDDVNGIQYLYGPPSFNSNPWFDSASLPTFDSEEETVDLPANESEPVAKDDDTGVCKNTVNQPRPQPCSCPQLDAITTLKNGQIYAFKGKYAYRIDEKSGLTSEMHRTEFIFKGLKEHDFDAALTTEDGQTYFFKGGKIWTTINKLLTSDQPSEFLQTFPEYPFDSVDAAFQWQDKTYFIRGNQFFVSDRGTKRYQGYSRPISDWGVSEDKIDASFRAPSGKIYLFRNEHFWILKETGNETLKVEPPLPQSTKVFFLNCSQSSS